MWLETPNNTLVNMDWILSLEIICTYDTKSIAPYHIRAYIKNDDSWVDFGRYETWKEANQEYQRLKSVLISNKE